VNLEQGVRWTADCRRSGAGGGGEIGAAEGLVEVVTGGEILPAILIGFPEFALFDEIEDEFTEVGAGTDAPFIEDEDGHGSVFLEGELADAFEEFGYGDVAGAGIESLGVVEGGAQEEVSLPGITGIPIHQQGDGCVEIAHEGEAVEGAAGTEAGVGGVGCRRSHQRPNPPAKSIASRIQTANCS
jgi:hypothetical protein